jgi:hypothetical protein
VAGTLRAKLVDSIPLGYQHDTRLQAAFRRIKRLRAVEIAQDGTFNAVLNDRRINTVQPSANNARAAVE